MFTPVPKYKAIQSETRASDTQRNRRRKALRASSRSPPQASRLPRHHPPQLITDRRRRPQIVSLGRPSSAQSVLVSGRRRRPQIEVTGSRSSSPAENLQKMAATDRAHLIPIHDPSWHVLLHLNTGSCDATMDIGKYAIAGRTEMQYQKS